MINPQTFYNTLKKYNINFFTGVPDSLLKDICAYITDNTEKNQNIITANEGNAISLAAGHYLATKEIGLVYMQNSGLGNAVNPLLSLTDPLVYSIPVLVLIGWRGEPGVKDEPQHIKQGQVTLNLLETMGIKYDILPNDESKLENCIKKAVKYMLENNSPYALVVRKNTFSSYSSYKLKQYEKSDKYELSREEALEIIISNIGEDSVIVSTTGKTSRELFELREKYNQTHEKDFLSVGSMGHALSISLGVALANPNKSVYCLDGDGALLMHMGGLGIVGDLSPKNLRHLVINNGSHESVGGQPTVGFNIDMQQIAIACGYKLALRADNKKDLINNLERLINSEELSFLEIKTNKGVRANLGRPTTSPIENKELLMKYIMGNNN